MKAVWMATFAVAALAEVAVSATGCSSSNSPSTTSATSGVSTGDDSGSGATTSSGGGSTSSGATGATGAGASTSSGSTGDTTGGSSSGASTSSGTSSGGSAESCDDVVDGGVDDKITTCTTGTSPACAKGCGPDLPAGSSQENLGNKTCTCNAGVYTCADCVYESPLPSCYMPASATPPACPAGAANKASCTAPCSGSGTDGVCAMVSDAGKAQGCVCVAGSSANVWTCATQWW